MIPVELRTKLIWPWVHINIVYQRWIKYYCWLSSESETLTLLWVNTLLLASRGSHLPPDYYKYGAESVVSVLRDDIGVPGVEPVQGTRIAVMPGIFMACYRHETDHVKRYNCGYVHVF